MKNSIDKIIAGKEIQVPKTRILKNQNIKRKILSYILISGLIFPTAGIAVKKYVSEHKLKTAYNTVLEKYANYDKEKSISDAEKSKFYRELLEANNLIYEQGKWPKYSNGEDVSFNDFTKMIKQYKPSSE